MGEPIHTQRDTHNQTSFNPIIQLFSFIKTILFFIKEKEYRMVIQTVGNDDNAFFLDFVCFFDIIGGTNKNFQPVLI